MDDLSELLRAWPYDPENRTRRINGADGRERLQVRSPVGIEQYELDGRPDGLQPFGQVSLLDHYLGKLSRHRQEHGSEDSFSLSVEACQALSEEGLLYYYRYVLTFQLGDYQRTARDTERNLQMFDLVSRYGVEDWDRDQLEQYRPYLIRMRQSARALAALDRKDYPAAEAAARRGVQEIERLDGIPASSFGHERERSLTILRGIIGQISEVRPPNEREALEQELQKAIESEDYEVAARLRDRLRRLLETPGEEKNVT